MSKIIDRYREADEARWEERGTGRAFNFGVTLLVLISVLFLCSSVALYIIKENEIEKRMFLENELADTTEELGRLAFELGEVKEAKIKIELEFALKEKELQDYKDRFSMLTMERSAIEGERTRFAEKSAVVQQDLVSLKRQFDQLQQAKEVLEQKLKSVMDSRVKLKTIIVEPEPSEEESIAEKTVEGEVLAVNKEYEFLVISLGANSGMSMNSDISIYRSSELIAIARVEKLYENISAVIVNDKGQMSRIRVGDAVVATVLKSPGNEDL